MKFSLAHLTALDCPPPELTYIAAAAGYDYVSPRIVMSSIDKGYSYDLAGNKTMLQETKKALAETGLQVNDIELVRITDGFDPQTLVPSFEVAAALGARYVLCSIWTVDRSFAIETFAEICDLAEPFGLVVGLEFVTWASVVNLREVVDVLLTADCKNSGVVIDLLHFHRSGVQLEELDNIRDDQFAFVHLCDAPKAIPDTKEGLIHTGRAERLYVGEGAIDIASIISRMPNVPYSIEIPHLVRAKELGSAEHALRCLKTAKAYFASHPLDPEGRFPVRATKGELHGQSREASSK